MNTPSVRAPGYAFTLEVMAAALAVAGLSMRMPSMRIESDVVELRTRYDEERMEAARQKRARRAARKQPNTSRSATTEDKR